MMIWIILGCSYLVAIAGTAVLLGRQLKRQRRALQRIDDHSDARLAELDKLSQAVEVQLRQAKPETLDAIIDSVSAVRVEISNVAHETQKALKLARSVQGRMAADSRWNDDSEPEPEPQFTRPARLPGRSG